MRIIELFLNVLLICCREKLQHVWDFYMVLVWMRVCGDFTKQSSVVMARLCVCVCVWERAREREARFLMSSGHWAERGKAYHVSVCNDTLDNAFCVHSNKMVKLNSTKVPAVSEKYMRQTAMQRLGWQTSIQCQYKCSLCCTALFLTVWTYKMVTDDKIMLHCLLWKIQVEECEGMFSGIFP